MTSPLSSFAGSVPQNYDDFLGPYLFEPYAIDLAEKVKGNKNNQILELACGTGRLTAHLVNILPEEASITATDLNADMLAIAKQKLSSPKVQWQVVDAQTLPFDDNSFDLVVCQFGIMFFPDKPKALGEAFRVLRQQGRLVLNTWDSLEYNPASAMVEEAAAEVFGGESPQFMKKAPFSFYDENEIRELLTEAGFKNISIERVPKSGRSASVVNVALGFLKGTPLAAFLQGKEMEKQQELASRLTEKLARAYGTEDLTMPMQAIVVQAEK